MPVSLNVLRFLYILLFVGQFASSHAIEGRWHPSGFENTMYEFLDGLRYTYYCAENNGCDSTCWNLVDTSDALPTINPYTVDGNIISIDLFFGTIATYKLGFRCDDQVVDFYSERDYIKNAEETGFVLLSKKEWWDNKEDLPRLISFLFEKST